MKVQLINYTKDAITTIATAAKLCYDKEGSITMIMEDLKKDESGEKAAKFVEKLRNLGHESPFEHVCYTFGIEGVSRALTHQLVRHRVGTSFSQRSQRYCLEDVESFVYPQVLNNTKEEGDVFREAMENAFKAYKELIALGVPKEDARAVLPNAATTSLVMTMNARQLFHFFHLRCCDRAQLEIRQLAFEMLRLVKAVDPIIFKKAGPACVKGFCPEGKMSCGKVRTLEEIIKGE